MGNLRLPPAARRDPVARASLLAPWLRPAVRRSSARLLAPWILLVAIALPLTCAAAAQAAPAGGASGASAPAPARASDAQLRAEELRLERVARGVGAYLLAADRRQRDAEQERDEALAALGAYLAAAYRTGGDADLLVEVIGSGDLQAATDRVRIAQQVGRYRASLLRSLDAAEAALDIGKLERARLIARLTDAQTRLDGVREQQRARGAAAAARAERRAAATERRLAQAAASAAAPGGLVAYAPGSSALGGGAFSWPSSVAGPAAAQSLDAYLAAKGSPMAGQGVNLLASGARWQVDPRLLVAIAGAESDFGNITCGPHNAWGWACPNDPADFATWAHGIDTVAEGLRRYYLDEGRTSVVLVQQKYAPNGAANDPTGLNSHWVTNVSRFMLELGGDPSRVGPGTLATPSVPDLGGLGLVADD